MPILINISKQVLFLQSPTDQCIAKYPISTAKNGVGEKKDSFQTPRGHHTIVEKIGENRPIFTVFSARKPTGELFSDELEKQFPNCDWILTRILWLAGSEPNVNCGGEVDTQSRFIYIHGTHDEKNIGTPHSHGCIRMRNHDIMALFDRVSVGDNVLIQ